MLLKNDLILRAARGEKTERTPVWLMRQAGRILPEYRAVREKIKDFKALVETPELAAEVTIQPVDILDVDAAIIFSDILVIPDAMGCTYEMIEKKGPSFPKTIRNQADINELRIIEGHELDYVYKALAITKSELNGRVPLIGFAGAPWTLLAYMTEGGGSKTFSKAKKFLYTEPALAHQLLDKITQSTIIYLKNQIKAGADMVQLFDSWAGLLGPDQYNEFSLQYISKIAASITEVPVTIFAKGAPFAFQEMDKIKCRTIGLDWTNDPIEAAKLLPGKTLQGNLDPCALYAAPAQLKKETEKMMSKFKGIPHIANLGHGVYPDTNPDQVKIFIETVKNYKKG